MDSDPSSLLALSLFGGFQATLDGVPLTAFESNKVRGLLAYMAVEQRPHSREALGDLLWPEQPEKTARQLAQRALQPAQSARGQNSRPALPAHRPRFHPVQPRAPLQCSLPSHCRLAVKALVGPKPGAFLPRTKEVVEIVRMSVCSARRSIRPEVDHLFYPCTPTFENQLPAAGQHSHSTTWRAGVAPA